MKRFKAILADGTVRSVWDENFAGSNHYEANWGKPQRELREQDAILQGEDLSKAINVEEKSTELGTAKFYTFAAEYTIEEQDITAEIEAKKMAENMKKVEIDSLKALKKADLKDAATIADVLLKLIKHLNL